MKNPLIAVLASVSDAEADLIWQVISQMVENDETSWEDGVCENPALVPARALMERLDAAKAGLAT